MLTALIWVAGIVLLFGIAAGLVLLALKLGIIVYKAAEKPEQGESESYRLEQGREVDKR